MEAKSEQELLQRLQELSPFATDEAARRALYATLGVLSEHLSDEEREFIAHDLPAEPAHVLLSQEHAPLRGLGEFFERVARKEGTRQAIGVEHAEVVCRGITECLSSATRERLLKHLPEFSRLFEIPDLPETPDHEPHRPLSAPRTLAEGRSGGSHPLATADTSSLAHRHSIARSDDPHADTKLSSAGMREPESTRAPESRH